MSLLLLSVEKKNAEQKYSFMPTTIEKLDKIRTFQANTFYIFTLHYTHFHIFTNHIFNSVYIGRS